MSNSKVLPPQHKWHIVACILLYVLAAGKLAVMLWSTNRGFDIGDEGLYMLSLNDPERYSVLAHGQFFSTILPIDQFTVPLSRTISIVLELIGGLVFSLGLHRWLSTQLNYRTSFWFVWAIVLTGSFHSLFARCVSYNDIIYFLGLSAAGVLLFSFSIRSILPRLLFWVVSFALVTFCTVFKSPVAISLSLLFLVVVGLSDNKTRLKNFGLGILALLAGGGVTIGLYTLLYSGYAWADVIIQVKQTADLLNYRPIDLILMYLIYDGIPNIVFLGIGAAMFGFTKHMLNTNTQLSALSTFAIAALASIVVGVAAITQFDTLLIPEERIAYPYLWLLMGIMLMLAYHLISSSSETKNSTWVVLGFLFALPIGMIGGTNGFITETLFTFWIPWFGVVAVGLSLLQEKEISFVKYPIIPLTLGLSMVMLFVETKVLHPFGIPENEDLFTQDMVFEGIDGLLLDDKSYQYFTSIQDLVKEHHNSEHPAILAMNYTPGLVYLTNGYSPGAPFYMFHEDFNDYNCQNIENARLDKVRPIIIYRTSTQADVEQCITNAGWGFPDEYTTEAIVDPYTTTHEDAETTDGKLYLAFPQ